MRIICKHYLSHIHNKVYTTLNHIIYFQYETKLYLFICHIHYKLTYVVNTSKAEAIVASTKVSILKSKIEMLTNINVQLNMFVSPASEQTW